MHDACSRCISHCEVGSARSCACTLRHELKEGLQIVQCPCSVARSTVFYGVSTLVDSRIEVVYIKI